MTVMIEEGWGRELAREWEKPYFERLRQEIHRAYGNPAVRVYPPAAQVLAAMDACPFDRVKVVILGQDPYHGPGQANGLAFSVNPGVRVPPSLLNIYKEIEAETGRLQPRDNGDLTRWASQGVLLLNTTLSVEEGRPMSHRGLGWEELTDAAIKKVNDDRPHVVFMLWGAHAGSKAWLVDKSKHLVLTAPHPSPLSAARGFFGCGHFVKSNEWLKEHGEEPIKW